MSRKLQLFTVITALSLPLSCAATSLPTKTNTTDNQRISFLAAERALSQGQLTQYRKIKAQLSTYPLLPYLEYQYLKKRLNHIQPDKIEAFLIANSDTPLHDRLFNSWLTTMYRHGQWQKLLKHYEPSNNTRPQCMKRWALYKTGNKLLAFEGIEQLWVIGHSQPKTCDKLFAAWQTSGQMTTMHVWSRFHLAMDANQTRLARYLTRFLPKQERPWARLWLKVHAKPQLINYKDYFKQDHPFRNDILIHGIKRLAYRDLGLAVNYWDSLRQRYAFSVEQRDSTERSLAMRHALRKEPDAVGWLSSLSRSDNNDPNISEWRVRAALDQGNWALVLYNIDILNAELQASTRWRYWRARALEALDQQGPAYELYWELAQSRGYYGFLAADRLGLNYQFENQPVPTDTDGIQNLKLHPGIQRAQELYTLNRISDARREWRYATSRLPEPLRQQAATLAHQWGWHDRAILTLADTHYRDNLGLRFPLAFNEQIFSAAQTNNIDPALAFALIRQESAFTPDARSQAGALGLMQLMPGTARQTARGMSLHFKNTRAALIDTEINLKLGMHHLRKILNRYQNNPVLAIASYNAGAHRVKQWIPEQGIKAADIWIETMPFKETRNYVQNILYFSTIYEQRLKNTILTTMTERMHPVRSAENLLANDTSNQAIDPS